MLAVSARVDPTGRLRKDKHVDFRLVRNSRVPEGVVSLPVYAFIRPVLAAAS
jgi:hypothetical protein